MTKKIDPTFFKLSRGYYVAHFDSAFLGIALYKPSKGMRGWHLIVHYHKLHLSWSYQTHHRSK